MLRRPMLAVSVRAGGSGLTGTLGCVVRMGARLLGLTACHVLVPDEVCSREQNVYLVAPRGPGPEDAYLGNLRGRYDEYDAAWFCLKRDREVPLAANSHKVSVPKVGTRIQSCGAASGSPTRGSIGVIQRTFVIPGGRLCPQERWLTEVFVVPFSTDRPFAVPGDSGSLVLEDEEPVDGRGPLAVGIVVARTSPDSRIEKPFVVCVPLRPVMDRLLESEEP